jgi:Fe-Mn family superoxide dismutase
MGPWRPHFVWAGAVLAKIPLLELVTIEDLMEYKLPPLPYAMDALEPAMSRETLEFHYGKHHRTYVKELNNLIKGSKFENATLEQIIRDSSGPLFNNAAQTWNHTFFWNCMAPRGGGKPTGALADAIGDKWGSYAQFKEAFSKSAISNFGSGWTWLVVRSDGVDIVNTDDADNPLTKGDEPLLTLDVWEHAYYIDYRNERPKFVEAFLKNLVNWDFALRNYENSLSAVAAH